MGKLILVKEIDTQEVIREIDVSRKTESQIDRAERGLLFQMDMEKYCTEIVEK